MVGVDNLHSHMGRATAATMFLSKGMPINVVSKVLGHTNLRLLNAMHALSAVMFVLLLML